MSALLNKVGTNDNPQNNFFVHFRKQTLNIAKKRSLEH